MTTHAAMPVPNDLDLLKLLTSTNGVRGGRYKRREAPLDPLLLAAAISSGPQITRHHYHHQLDVPVVLDTSIDTPRPTMAPAASGEVAKPRYNSQQAPRSQRLKERHEDSDKENQPAVLGNTGNLPRRSRGTSQQSAQTAVAAAAAAQSTSSSNGPTVIGAGPAPPSPFIPSFSTPTLTKPLVRNLQPIPLQVQCMARTRIPTPHGPAFLHLYRNNKDAKEHLAFVIDPAQLDSSPNTTEGNFIRSTSLDAKWSEDETEMDRLTRGAYVGRLSPDVHKPSTPPADPMISSSTRNLLPPLVRIHSECFTGETIGSMRCDCGEQLDEAIRQIFQPISSTLPGRGAVIYLRQEGRGIGLLSKIRAYNLQDMGHDTVQANLLLGHGADERRYDIAAAIMRDLGLEEVELLTNNPDKVKSLEVEGIKVAKRRGMVPRSWQAHSHLDAHHEIDGDVRLPGATLIGGGAAHGPELEKYLRTKVERMGHMLDLPLTDMKYW